MVKRPTHRNGGSWYDPGVSRFWAGFATATALWVGAAAVLHFALGFGPPPEQPVAALDVEPAAEEPEVEEEEARPRRRRRRGRRGRGRGRTPSGTATTGDDLGEDEMRTLDMEGGGEAQLRPSQIEAGFDQGMGRIRRCLVLMEGDEAVTGRLTFGLRIAGTGRVQRVRLSGPRAATTGEAGTCLRNAARNLTFDSFDGPEMIVNYPLTLE